MQVNEQNISLGYQYNLSQLSQEEQRTQVKTYVRNLLGYIPVVFGQISGLFRVYENVKQLKQAEAHSIKAAFHAKQITRGGLEALGMGPILIIVDVIATMHYFHAGSKKPAAHFDHIPEELDNDFLEESRWDLYSETPQQSPSRNLERHPIWESYLNDV